MVLRFDKESGAVGNILKSDWLVTVSEILVEEPEEWLSYLYGQQSRNIPQSKSAAQKRGWFLGAVSFWAEIFRNSSIFSSECQKQSEFLVFANTQNQASALSSTVEWLRAKDVHVETVTMSSELSRGSRGSRYRRLRFCSQDILRTAYLFVSNAPRLYSRLKSLRDTSVVSNFDSFCMTYAYLTSFHRILIARCPRFVVVANDHSPENRCLLAVANVLGVDTVYLQHASVTSLFPALNVKYAFLDGEYSLNIYRACEENRPPNRKNYLNPIVFLTGQKKNLNCKSRVDSTRVGVAVNSLDNPHDVVGLVRDLSEHGFEVVFRWHPRQNRSHVDCFKAQFEGEERVSLSDPGLEDVATFLCSLRCLVAGNSSIHLEAALVGVVPVYYEEEHSRVSDYYGYVRHGLSIPVHSKLGLINLLSDLDRIVWSNGSPIKYYSSTFNTQWEGREGELVARLLLAQADKKMGEGRPCVVGDMSFGPYRLIEG